MKDINFFLPYVGKSKLKFNNKFFLAIIFILFASSVIGYGTINHFKAKNLNKEIMKFKITSEDSITLQEVETIRAEQEKLDGFIIEIEEISNLKAFVSERDIIDATHIDNIVMKIPEGLFLTSLYIGQDSTSISGISNSTMSVAEFAKGLETIKGLGEVFISNITKEESNTDYTFNMESILILEEEVEDGGEVESDDETAEDY